MANEVNPNALGAPAEGFGQTVSFAFDPRGDVPTVQPITSSPRGGGISGGLSPQLANPQAGYHAAPRKDPTGALLLKVGEEIIGKKLDEQRTVKFVEGMQRAMSGEAITEVVASVPWYAKIFGDTPAIEGARAYTAAAQVNEQIAKQTANMSSIQTLDAAGAAKHFSGVINQSLTGDPGTDNVIMKGMTEQLPALMKAQAKSHYGYVQKKAMTALSRNIETGAQGLQAYGQLFAEDKVTEADMDKVAQSYIASIIPPDGIDEDNYTKTLTGNMRRMAANGQFHALAALKKSGVLQALPPEQAGQIEAATLSSATKARDNYAFQYAREIAEIKSDAANPQEGGTPAALAARIDGMNAKYQKLTGSPVGLFSSDQKADMIAGTFNAIKAEQVRATRNAETLANKGATAAAKEQAAAELDSSVTALVVSSEMGALKLMSGVTSDMIDRKVLSVVQQDPVKGGDILANAWIKDHYVSGPIAQKLQQPMRLSEGKETPEDGWFASVVKFNELKASTGGLPYASDYFGPYAKKLERASRMLGDNVLDNPEAVRIFQATMGGTQETPRDPLSAKERQGVIAKVTNLNSNALVRKFTGSINLRADAIALVSEVASANIEDWRGTGMDDTTAVQQGVTEAISSGKLELIGGYGIRNYDGKPGGKRLPTLKELASTALNQVPKGREDAYFEGFLREVGKVPDDGNTVIIRKGEGGGAYQFTVLTKMPDGSTPVFNFTSTQWQSYAASKTTKDTKADAHKWAYGPALTVGTRQPGNVSPYADAASRAARRAEQERKLNRPKSPNEMN